MDFDFTSEQNLLRDTLAGFLADCYDFETRRKVTQSPSGWREGIWHALAQDLNLFGAAFPEALGGLGGGAVEHAIVMEEFGKALVLEPYLPTLVIGGGALVRAGGALAQEFVPRIVAGELVLAFAHSETGTRHHLADVQTTARRDAGEFVISGRKTHVAGGPWATHFLVTVRTGGAARDPRGVTLLLVDRDAPGVSTRDYPTIDGGRASELTLTGVRVPAARAVGEPGDAMPLLEHVADAAVCALCAEAVGAMRRMLDDTVAYASQRKQFGTPLATFQVLQHRMADMFVMLEQTVALTQVATLRLDATPRERTLAASAAKVQADRAGRALGQAAIQIHGGMGITEELALGHYFRRLTAIGAQWGSADFHAKRYADLALADVA